MTDATTSIREVGTIFVPVADQDRALEFYVEKLGFEKRAEFVYGERHRWIEVSPPGAGNNLALVPESEGVSAGGDVARCALATSDIEALHEVLRARDVDVDAEIGRAGTARPAWSRPTCSSRVRSRRSSSSRPRREPFPDRPGRLTLSDPSGGTSRGRSDGCLLGLLGLRDRRRDRLRAR